MHIGSYERHRISQPLSTTNASLDGLRAASAHRAVLYPGGPPSHTSGGWNKGDHKGELARRFSVCSSLSSFNPESRHHQITTALLIVFFQFKAAYTLQELNLLLEGESLDGIKVVDEQRANVQKVGKRNSLKGFCVAQRVRRHPPKPLSSPFSF